MSKGLARWVAGAFLVWTGFAQALGLGEIESRSRLNQLVSAQIPIVSASTAELDSLSVSLAANEEFDRAGIERGEFLSTLRFIVENQTIRVTSKQIAREPFVTFLLEVRWSGGRPNRQPASPGCAGIATESVAASITKAGLRRPHSHFSAGWQPHRLIARSAHCRRC